MTEPFSLNVERERTHKSLAGAFASLVYYSACIFFLVRLGMQYFDTTNPSFNYVVNPMEMPPRVDLVKNKLLPIVHFSVNDTRNLLHFLDYEVHIKIDSKQGNERTIKTFSQLVNCDLIMNQTDYFEGVSMTERYRKLIFQAGLCVDIRNETLRSQLFLSGSITTEDIDFMSLVVVTRRNATIPVFGSPEASDRSEVTIAHILPVLKLQDQENPVRFRIKEEDYPFQNESIYYQDKYVNTKTIEDEFGWPSTERRKTTVYEITSETVKQRRRLEVGQLLMQFDYQVSNDKTTITRNYPNIMDIAGTFGGIHDILKLMVMLIWSLFYSPISRPIANKLFKLDAQDNLHEALDVPQDEGVSDHRSIFTWCIDVFCCNKKTHTYKDRKLQAAKDLIEHNLDALTIVRKLNLVTAMSEILFSRNDLAILQAASLAFYQNDRNKELFQETKGTKHIDKIMISKIVKVNEPPPAPKPKKKAKKQKPQIELPPEEEDNLRPSPIAPQKEDNLRPSPIAPQKEDNLRPSPIAPQKRMIEPVTDSNPKPSNIKRFAQINSTKQVVPKPVLNIGNFLNLEQRNQQQKALERGAQELKRGLPVVEEEMKENQVPEENTSPAGLKPHEQQLPTSSQEKPGHVSLAQLIAKKLGLILEFEEGSDLLVP
jgi:hypothetical protein